MIEKVGNVKLIAVSEGIDTSYDGYSDGDAEDVLLDIFKSKDSGRKIARVLSDNNSWPLTYHLSPERGNIVDWYDFKQNTKVLEVGSGCGAITEALIKKDILLDSLELTYKRSLINANRNKKSQNLRILVGNLEDYSSNQLYDYVVCVGVLEYAGSFISGPNPYSKFLKILRSHLKPGGKLILAIENRLGLKYWSGAHEDHTALVFDSIENYLGDKKVQTFGRLELQKLLEEHFETTDFYYPYPDYKLPHMIYSDHYLPGTNCDFPLGQLPSPSPDRSRVYLYSETLAMKSIEKNELFSNFSNSFLVVAGQKQEKTQAKFSVFQNKRRNNFQLSTKIYDNYSIKTAMSNESSEHIDQMLKTYETLEKSPLKKKINVVMPRQISKTRLRFDFVEGETLENELLQAILDNNKSKAKSILMNYLKMLDALPKEKTNPSENGEYIKIFGDKYNKKVSCYKYVPIDLNLDNIITNKNQLHLIDVEWFFEFPVPAEYLFGRFVYWFFISRYRDIFALISNKYGFKNYDDLAFIPPYLIDVIEPYLDKEVLYRVVANEVAFQYYVTGNEVSVTDMLYKWSDRRINVRELIDKVNDVESKLSAQNELVSYMEEEIKKLLHSIELIKKSRTYKLAQKLQKLRPKK